MQRLSKRVSCHFIFVHFSGNLCCRWNASLSFCTFFRTEIFVEIRVNILTTERMATQAGVLTSARNMKRSHALVSIPRLLGLFLVWTLLVHQLAFATSENEESSENVIIENEQMSMWQRVFGGGDDTVKKLEARMLRVEEQLRHDNERLNAEIQELRVEIGSHSDIQGMLVRDVLQAVKFLREIREEEASRREDVSEGETLEKRFAVFSRRGALCLRMSRRRLSASHANAQRHCRGAPSELGQQLTWCQDCSVLFELPRCHYPVDNTQEFVVADVSGRTSFNLVRLQADYLCFRKNVVQIKAKGCRG